jgi:hypothetical protein
MSEAKAGYFGQLAAAGAEVIQGNYRAATRIFDLTREGSCPQEVGELAEVLGFMTVKVEAREHALEKALSEVRRQNQALEEAAERRAEFSKVFCGSILLLCLYSLTLAFFQSVMKLDMSPLATGTHLMNLALFVMLAVLMTWYLKRHRYPLSSFGLTWNNWRRAVAESLLICGPVLALLAAIKAVLVRYHPAFSGKPVIEWTNWGPWQMFVIYIFVTLAQELSTRGFLLTCVERLLTGERRTQIAVWLGAAQFGVVHLHYSFGLGMLSLFGAALFGTLYARHRTIVGVTLAHYILGQCIFGPLQLMQ